MLGTVSRASGEVLMEARSVSEVFLIFRLDCFFCRIPVPRCGRWGADTGSADQGTPQLRPGSNVANMPPPSASTRSIGPLGPVRLLGVAPALRDKHDLLSRWVVDHRRAFVNFALRKLKVIPRSRCRPQIFAPFFAPRFVIYRGLRIRHRHFGGRSVRDAHGWTGCGTTPDAQIPVAPRGEQFALSGPAGNDNGENALPAEKRPSIRLKCRTVGPDPALTGCW